MVSIKFTNYGWTSRDVVLVNVITDWIERKEVLLPVNHNYFNFRKIKYTYEYKYKYKYKYTANCPITLSDNNCTERFMKNKAASAPIIFEEFVMVMIR